MSKSLKQTLFWAPRLLAILFVLFLGLFALDVFDTGLGFWETLLGLFMHLIPNILLAILIILAWKWEWIGALGFLGWAVFYLFAAGNQHWSAYLIVAGIPVLIGLLFLAGWVWRKHIRG